MIMRPNWDSETQTSQREERGVSLRLAFLLAAFAALSVGIAVRQILDRRLTRPEKARLRFYRYLREKGHLES